MIAETVDVLCAFLLESHRRTAVVALDRSNSVDSAFGWNDSLQQCKGGRVLTELERRTREFEFLCALEVDAVGLACASLACGPPPGCQRHAGDRQRRLLSRIEDFVSVRTPQYLPQLQLLLSAYAGREEELLEALMTRARDEAGQEVTEPFPECRSELHVGSVDHNDPSFSKGPRCHFGGSTSTAGGPMHPLAASELLEECRAVLAENIGVWDAVGQDVLLTYIGVHDIAHGEDATAAAAMLHAKMARASYADTPTQHSMWRLLEQTHGTLDAALPFRMVTLCQATPTARPVAALFDEVLNERVGGALAESVTAKALREGSDAAWRAIARVSLALDDTRCQHSLSPHYACHVDVVALFLCQFVFPDTVLHVLQCISGDADCASWLNPPTKHAWHAALSANVESAAPVPRDTQHADTLRAWHYMEEIADGTAAESVSDMFAAVESAFDGNVSEMLCGLDQTYSWDPSPPAAPPPSPRAQATKALARNLGRTRPQTYSVGGCISSNGLYVREWSSGAAALRFAARCNEGQRHLLSEFAGDHDYVAAPLWRVVEVSDQLGTPHVFTAAPLVPVHLHRLAACAKDAAGICETHAASPAAFLAAAMRHTVAHVSVDDIEGRSLALLPGIDLRTYFVPIGPLEEPDRHTALDEAVGAALDAKHRGPFERLAQEHRLLAAAARRTAALPCDADIYLKKYGFARLLSADAAAITVLLEAQVRVAGDDFVTIPARGAVHEGRRLLSLVAASHHRAHPFLAPALLVEPVQAAMRSYFLLRAFVRTAVIAPQCCTDDELDNEVQRLQLLCKLQRNAPRDRSRMVALLYAVSAHLYALHHPDDNSASRKPNEGERATKRAVTQALWRQLIVLTSAWALQHLQHDDPLFLLAASAMLVVVVPSDLDSEWGVASEWRRRLVQWFFDVLWRPFDSNHNVAARNTVLLSRDAAQILGRSADETVQALTASTDNGGCTKTERDVALQVARSVRKAQWVRAVARRLQLSLLVTFVRDSSAAQCLQQHATMRWCAVDAMRLLCAEAARRWVLKGLFDLHREYLWVRERRADEEDALRACGLAHFQHRILVCSSEESARWVLIRQATVSAAAARVAEAARTHTHIASTFCITCKTAQAQLLVAEHYGVQLAVLTGIEAIGRRDVTEAADAQALELRVRRELLIVGTETRGTGPEGTLERRERAVRSVATGLFLEDYRQMLAVWSLNYAKPCLARWFEIRMTSSAHRRSILQDAESTVRSAIRKEALGRAWRWALQVPAHAAALDADATRACERKRRLLVAVFQQQVISNGEAISRCLVVQAEQRVRDEHIGAQWVALMRSPLLFERQMLAVLIAESRARRAIESAETEVKATMLASDWLDDRLLHAEAAFVVVQLAEKRARFAILDVEAQIRAKHMSHEFSMDDVTHSIVEAQQLLPLLYRSLRRAELTAARRRAVDAALERGRRREQHTDDGAAAPAVRVSPMRRVYWAMDALGAEQLASVLDDDDVKQVRRKESRAKLVRDAVETRQRRSLEAVEEAARAKLVRSTLMEHATAVTMYRRMSTDLAALRRTVVEPQGLRVAAGVRPPRTGLAALQSVEQKARAAVAREQDRVFSVLLKSAAVAPRRQTAAVEAHPGIERRSRFALRALQSVEATARGEIVRQQAEAFRTQLQSHTPAVSRRAAVTPVDSRQVPAPAARPKARPDPASPSPCAGDFTAASMRATAALGMVETASRRKIADAFETRHATLLASERSHRPTAVPAPRMQTATSLAAIEAVESAARSNHQKEWSTGFRSIVNAAPMQSQLVEPPACVRPHATGSLERVERLARVRIDRARVNSAERLRRAMRIAASRFSEIRRRLPEWRSRTTQLEALEHADRVQIEASQLSHAVEIAHRMNLADQKDTVLAGYEPLPLGPLGSAATDVLLDFPAPPEAPSVARAIAPWPPAIREAFRRIEDAEASQRRTLLNEELWEIVDALHSARLRYAQVKRAAGSEATEAPSIVPLLRAQPLAESDAAEKRVDAEAGRVSAAAQQLLHAKMRAVEEAEAARRPLIHTQWLWGQLDVVKRHEQALLGLLGGASSARQHLAGSVAAGRLRKRDPQPVRHRSLVALLVERFERKWRRKVAQQRAHELAQLRMALLRAVGDDVRSDAECELSDASDDGADASDVLGSIAALVGDELNIRVLVAVERQMGTWGSVASLSPRRKLAVAPPSISVCPSDATLALEDDERLVRQHIAQSWLASWLDITAAEPDAAECARILARSRLQRQAESERDGARKSELLRARNEIFVVPKAVRRAMLIVDTAERNLRRAIEGDEEEMWFLLRLRAKAGPRSRNLPPLVTRAVARRAEAPGTAEPKMRVINDGRTTPLSPLVRKRTNRTPSPDRKPSPSSVVSSPLAALAASTAHLPPGPLRQLQVDEEESRALAMRAYREAVNRRLFPKFQALLRAQHVQRSTVRVAPRDDNLPARQPVQCVPGPNVQRSDGATSAPPEPGVLELLEFLEQSEATRRSALLDEELDEREALEMKEQVWRGGMQRLLRSHRDMRYTRRIVRSELRGPKKPTFDGKRSK